MLSVHVLSHVLISVHAAMIPKDAKAQMEEAMMKVMEKRNGTAE